MTRTRHLALATEEVVKITRNKDHIFIIMEVNLKVRFMEGEE
jgi:hypothetical protein